LSEVDDWERRQISIDDVNLRKAEKEYYTEPESSSTYRTFSVKVIATIAIEVEVDGDDEDEAKDNAEFELIHRLRKGLLMPDTIEFEVTDDD